MNLKLDQALILAKKKLKEGSTVEAKRIYQSILARFPANKKAKHGMRALSSNPDSETQKPTQNQLQLLIKLYSQGQLQQALNQADALLSQFPRSVALNNICGAI